MTSPTVEDEIDDDSGERCYVKFVQDESCKYVQVGEVVTCFKDFLFVLKVIKWLVYIVINDCTE